MFPSNLLSLFPSLRVSLTLHPEWLSSRSWHPLHFPSPVFSLLIFSHSESHPGICFLKDLN